MKWRWPMKKITIIGETSRYQKLESAQYAYLLGVKIVSMSDEDKLASVLRCAAVVGGVWLTVPQNKTRRVTSETGHLARQVSEELS